VCVAGTTATGAVVAVGDAVVVTVVDATVVADVDATVVGVVLDVVLVAVELHVDSVTLSDNKVTAPVLARTRPVTATPFVSDADVEARMVPTNLDVVFKVAEELTCQKTLHG
jgi:hypothetical protein